jgi:hypothetical protein
MNFNAEWQPTQICKFFFTMIGFVAGMLIKAKEPAILSL